MPDLFMKKTCFFLKKMFAFFVVSIAALVFSQKALAASGAIANCQTGEKCTLGEFLFDDNYTPITSATCTLTSYDPSGASFLGVGLTAAADGWYGYEFTAPETVGYYRSQICCQSGDDDLCLDKSFEVSTAVDSVSADEIASAVWSYSSRTMSGFGNLIADIWSYSSRNLSGFGTLIADLWGHTSRTLTGTQATNITNITNDVASIEAAVAENRRLLEQIVNKPVIQNFLEESVDLNVKIEKSKDIADSLFIKNQYIVSRVWLLSSRWNKLSEKELLSSIMDLNSFMGEETEGKDSDSVFGVITWLSDSWSWPVNEEIKDQARAVKASFTTVQKILGSEGKSKAALEEMKDLGSFLARLEKLIGDNTDRADKKTLFGFLKDTGELAVVLDNRESEVNSLLADWEKKPKTASKLSDTISDLSKKIMAVNRIPKAVLALTSSVVKETAEKRLKNQLLAMRGLIASNRLLLAKGPSMPLANTWLEEGSIVFKSLVTNPSKIISQKVSLKYYLPPEVKKENIIETDEGLTVNFDAEKNQYYVEGEFTLAAGETKTLSVKVADIWIISKDEVESLRQQAEELSRPLEKTSFFAQGITLKSDIDVSLNKILVLQEGKITPEEKIRAFREAQIELSSVKTKIDALKGLVTQASSSGTFFGFVGGTQTLAVWGLIIILLAGFVFLAVYMKIIAGNNNSKGGSEKPAPAKLTAKTESVKTAKVKSPQGQFMKSILIFFAFGLISAAVSGVVVRRITVSALAEKEKVEEGSRVAEEKTIPESKIEEEPLSEKETLRVLVDVPESSAVNVREFPKLGSSVLVKLKSSQEAEALDVCDDWIKVSFSSGDGISEPLVGWVSKDFLTLQ